MHLWRLFSRSQLTCPDRGLSEFIPKESSYQEATCTVQGRQSWGIGGRDPQLLAGGGRGGSQVGCGGREILLYFIIYWKYVRK